ncbi:3-deoxy-manno-octulosonate cytidylyltransferase [Polynucleobacter asymbioticus]|jgi:3-deoxy-manno-octulosonate cytidylyltransferase (CMP-KDO synthetase)|uniref:3-deoxy-manno-octulosonate cytidylyltransferase n=1 Tax=Polynucleobacter asymbioticus (strain DSM 18221 / CIP 109841 / QLW-P1DMWA-1) TaxID=312153 RepID=KDSB_POLAQ|nr:3-deoxy-manno-octulosonate cytidylyltransferase [Polynucleobacter asymbioticus]A4SVI9.1 RecName: Full=3-deoxy-manno-octulosonate cytidylyltransferase; AltName: Full=CMP-2-keto-3-deoxyoctulosonic acid synthase; Short=CKS; Short=CMP-KDO synthase [Polynucleobacter asymbioticus QLW-P1DMWA-1]ABP33503.1 3-deoxy-D-manno-octulosonate cytidylyltransferase [Polynucleobacter asymbioticus QLW-P1DMWA-1]
MSTAPKAPDFLVVIPARLGSTRLPRKPLADIGGKPMVVRVAERAKQSLAHSVIVATDSPEIQAACDEHRIECLLTSPDHPTGTDRIAEVAQLLKLPSNALVVNVQGDEPLIPPELINQVAQTLAEHPQCAISTVAVLISEPSEIDNSNVVKVVLNREGEALYFSRAPIPYVRDPQELIKTEHLRHLGIYAYRADFLQAYTRLDPAPPEQAEALEQLRALWNGYRIAVHTAPEAPPAGVDTLDDLERVRQLLGNT